MDTSEKIEILINAIRDQPMIYDRSKRQSPGCLGEVWSEIAKEVGLPVPKCKEKWKNLRDAFVKMKRRHKDNVHESSKAPQKEWKWAKQMTFMEEHVDIRHTENDECSGYFADSGPSMTDDQSVDINHDEDTPKLASVHEIDDFNLKAIFLSHDQMSDVDSQGESEKKWHNECSMRLKRKKETHRATSKMKAAKLEDSEFLGCNGDFDVLQDVSPAPMIEKLDGEKAFGLSVANDLRNLSDQERAFAKFKIQELLYKISSGALRPESS